MERVIGIDLLTPQLTPRVVGIAGGESKIPAILASLKAKWLNVLITDRCTAEQLIGTEL
jgi:DNA-binding transcriptional regulator LsrR (DeoR family)